MAAWGGAEQCHGMVWPKQPLPPLLSPQPSKRMCWSSVQLEAPVTSKGKKGNRNWTYFNGMLKTKPGPKFGIVARALAAACHGHPAAWVVEQTDTCDIRTCHSHIIENVYSQVATSWLHPHRKVGYELGQRVVTSASSEQAATLLRARPPCAPSLSPWQPTALSPPWTLAWDWSGPSAVSWSIWLLTQALQSKHSGPMQQCFHRVHQQKHEQAGQQVDQEESWSYQEDRVVVVEADQSSDWLSVVLLAAWPWPGCCVTRAWTDPGPPSDSYSSLYWNVDVHFLYHCLLACFLACLPWCGIRQQSMHAMVTRHEFRNVSKMHWLNLSPSTRTIKAKLTACWQKTLALQTLKLINCKCKVCA